MHLSTESKETVELDENKKNESETAGTFVSVFIKHNLKTNFFIKN